MNLNWSGHDAAPNPDERDIMQSHHASSAAQGRNEFRMALHLRKLSPEHYAED